MIGDPIQHFLGVSATTDSLRVLGLAPGRLDASMIESALERQLARVYQHPDAGDPDADRVRQRLRAAAAELRASVAAGRLGQAYSTASSTAPRVAKAPVVSRFRLTQFDRQVLAVLVSFGGWNARSRARLVALAGANKVSVQGLLRVLKGLAEYARGGGPRLGLQDITGGQTFMPPSSDASIDELPVTPALLDRLAARLADELQREGRWPTVKLSLIFGSITLLTGIVVMWWLVTTSSPPRPTPNTSTNTSAVVSPILPLNPVTTAAQSPTINEPRALTFRRLPTFLGNGLPIQSAAAADKINETLASLDDVVRRLSVSAEPAEAVYRIWEDSLRSIATGWPLMDASARQGAAQKIDEALSVAAASPDIMDRLLRSLVPPGTGQLVEPIDIWRGSWLAGTLGHVAGSSTLPPVVIEKARALLNASLGPAAAEATGGFNAVAAMWLDGIVPQLVRLANIDNRAYDAWELWITAQRMIGGGDRHQAAIMLAIQGILESSNDLGDAGPPQNVLGRLIELALNDPSAVVRDRMSSFYDNSTITVRDLWVLTSLLSAGPAKTWIVGNLVVPLDADDLHRSRLRDALAQAWPMPSIAQQDQPAQALGAAIDPAMGQRWLAALDAIFAQTPATSPEGLTRQLILTSRTIEAIDELLAHNQDRAENLLTSLEEALSENADPAGDVRTLLTRFRPGQPLGMDGQWTAEYGDLGRSEEDRLQSLRGLRTNAGTDLGPIDAATLVHEAYRGTTMDIRTLAMGIAGDQFGNGPIVAMELLNQFPDARPTAVLSDMIGRMSGRVLPAVRTPQWPIEARLALVNHVMELRPGALQEIDVLSQALTDSYTRRLAAVDPDASSNTAPESPAEAAQLLAGAWLDRAGVTLASNPVPADLGGIQQRLAIRLKLAEGPIQQFVAYQLNILDLLAYITVAEQPQLREPVIALLRNSAQHRAGMHGVVEQSLDVERTVADLWRLRVGLVRQELPENPEPEESES